MSVEEKKEIQKIREALGRKYCHRCDYCQPCPQGIPISTVLDAKSLLKRMALKTLLGGMDPSIEKARGCTECEECIERCPYDLPIPELLRENIATWEEKSAIACKVMIKKNLGCFPITNVTFERPFDEVYFPFLSACAGGKSRNRE